VSPTRCAGNVARPGRVYVGRARAKERLPKTLDSDPNRRAHSCPASCEDYECPSDTYLTFCEMRIVAADTAKEHLGFPGSKARIFPVGDSPDASPPARPLRSMQTGQNCIAPENSLPQLGQVRLGSVLIFLTALQPRRRATPLAPSGAKSASTASGILLSRRTSDRVFPDTTGPPDHVSGQNSRVLRLKLSTHRCGAVSSHHRGSRNPRPSDPLAFW
jgi:hypothetical protein